MKIIGVVTYFYTMFHYFRRWMDESARVIATSTHNIFQSRSESCLSWYAGLLAVRFWYAYLAFCREAVAITAIFQLSHAFC